MRASRLINILTSLQARGRLTAAQLASENQVSLRTIYRDVEQLSLAGIPLVSDRGADGGYRLLEGYRMSLNGLSADEAQALFLAGLPGPIAELGLGAVLSSAERKLTVALPEGLRPSASLARNRFHLDSIAWFGEADQPRHLVAVASAVWQCRRLTLRYRSWKEEKSVTTEPLGIVLKGGAWYLVSRTDDEVRTYRVSRVLACEEAGDAFERPEGFDLPDYWRKSTDRFETELYPTRARLRVSSLGASLARELAPGIGTSIMIVADEPDEQGWFDATIQFGSIRGAACDLLRFGAEVEVLAPAELRDRLRDDAARVVERYAR